MANTLHSSGVFWFYTAFSINTLLLRSMKMQRLSHRGCTGTILPLPILPIPILKTIHRIETFRPYTFSPFTFLPFSPLWLRYIFICNENTQPPGLHGWIFRSKLTPQREQFLAVFSDCHTGRC